MELIDTHTHLDSEDFNGDQAEVIARAQAAGVTRFITIGASRGFESNDRAIALAERYHFIWASVGIHPQDGGLPLDMARVRNLAKHPRVVAIGETGLDFFRDRAPRDAQEAWFRGHIELALELKKPIIIHSRDAGPECLTILQEMGAAAVGGVFHCFSENGDFAEKLRNINFLISIPGNVTFKKAEQMRQAVAATPLSQIMVETDAPYLSPEPHRGKRCESAFMVETARCIAKVKGISLEEVAEVTTQNALRLFKI